jgi:2-keto-4-pentenoate hydratase
VADNGSSALFVLGAARLGLDEFEPKDVTMTMTVNGQPASTGTGEACLGDPLNALLWLAEVAQRAGKPLLAGDVVLSGALGPMAAVSGGDRVWAEVGPLGTVSVSFEEER